MAATPPPLDAKDAAVLRTAEQDARAGHVDTGLKLLYDTLDRSNAPPAKRAAYAQELEKAGLINEFALDQVQIKRQTEGATSVFKDDVTKYADATKDPFQRALFQKAVDNFDTFKGSTSYLGLGSHYLYDGSIKEQLSDYSAEHRAIAMANDLARPDAAGVTLATKLADAQGYLGTDSIDAALKTPKGMDAAELAAARNIQKAYHNGDPAVFLLTANGSVGGFVEAHKKEDTYLTPDPPPAPIEPVRTNGAAVADVNAPTGALVIPDASKSPFGALEALQKYSVASNPFGPVADMQTFGVPKDTKTQYTIGAGQGFASASANAFEPISAKNPAGYIPAAADADKGLKGADDGKVARASEDAPIDRSLKATPIGDRELASDRSAERKKEVKVEAGWGYWSVAASALNLPPYGTKGLTPAQLYKIGTLTQKLQHAYHHKVIYAGETLQIPDF